MAEDPSEQREHASSNRTCAYMQANIGSYVRSCDYKRQITRSAFVQQYACTYATSKKEMLPKRDTCHDMVST